MQFKHKFDETILREYDIRGIVNQTLNELDSYMLGYFFGITIKRKIKINSPKIVVSRDGRLTSSSLIKKLVEGLLMSGAKVTDIGLNPTPVLYFGNEALKVDGAIQVTGSHNPKNYNGFKMIALNKPFFGLDILKLSKFAESGFDEVFSADSSVMGYDSSTMNSIKESLEIKVNR